MSAFAIHCEDVGKQYRFGAVPNDFPTLRDSLASGVSRLFRKAGSEENGNRSFWALRDVSFEARQGETLGVIGNNGAGKSTLLKLLSRITRPTKGQIIMRGRVSSLLEVGTGFHPELTGRENIFLNGAILGMSHGDIRRKFDEIVLFSEVERFIDTPVKHYSTGMYLRLAFAVAAHLEPDLLIVDEVLAVGDAAFQQKCIGRMNDVAREGRTVVFVSHNLGAVQSFCHRALVLREGRIVADGTSSYAVASYLQTLEAAALQTVEERTDRLGNGLVRLTRISLSTGGPEPSATLATGRSALFAFEYAPARLNVQCSFTVYDRFGNPVASFDSAAHGPCDRLSDRHLFECEIDILLLLPGRYRVTAGLVWNGELQDHVEAAVMFEVEPGHIEGRPAPMESGYGVVCIPHRWTTPAT